MTAQARLVGRDEDDPGHGTAKHPAVRRRRPGVPAAETSVQIGDAVFDGGVDVVEFPDDADRTIAEGSGDRLWVASAHVFSASGRLEVSASTPRPSTAPAPRRCGCSPTTSWASQCRVRDR